jgi:hypothetical protein
VSGHSLFDFQEEVELAGKAEIKHSTTTRIPPNQTTDRNAQKVNLKKVIRHISNIFLMQKCLPQFEVFQTRA